MTDHRYPGAFGVTPSQTVGPFFHHGLLWPGSADLVETPDLGGRLDLVPRARNIFVGPARKARPQGLGIEIVGFVLDGAQAPVADAMIEIWQANAAGRYNAPTDDRADIPLDPSFVGFGRSSTDENGSYRFRTIMPGRVPGPGNCLQAPHIAIAVFGRGLLKRLVTRIYFEQSDGNDVDPILSLVPQHRRRTLIAARADPAVNIYRFDIVLQGKDETVFFSI